MSGRGVGAGGKFLIRGDRATSVRRHDNRPRMRRSSVKLATRVADYLKADTRFGGSQSLDRVLVPRATRLCSLPTIGKELPSLRVAASLSGGF
ncbi:hypothetical protein IE4803_PB00352 (plasmid) [Rhizobium etli bv. phaseoli str. IE4803]|nr:hypothetical protein IE4803_PB00352 [Rhizobium etli bv. phaseoli str. IE4803]